MQQQIRFCKSADGVRLAYASVGAGPLRMLDAFGNLDVQDVAPQVRVPTLILHARSDLRVPFEEGRRLAALIPDARFVPLECRDHWPLEQEPAFEQMMREIDAFLEADNEGDAATRPARLPERTDRESEVIYFVARGLSNGQIADRLRITDKTVRNHITNIFMKLGVTSRAEAIVRARDAGIGVDGRTK